MKYSTVSRSAVLKVAMSVFCIVTLLLVAFCLISSRQTREASKQGTSSHDAKETTTPSTLAHVPRQYDFERITIEEKDLLTTIQEQSSDVTCFPIELVICTRIIHEYEDFEHGVKSPINDRSLDGSLDEEGNELLERMDILRGHYECMCLFRTDRYLDLTFEGYLPLSRIINKAQLATQDDLQSCLDYIPKATPSERALIFSSFYIYIERMYRDGTYWEDDPNTLEKSDQKFINKLIKSIKKNTSSNKIAFHANQLDLDELARQWQVSFRRLFWNLLSGYGHNRIFLTESELPWFEVTLDSPDTFLYSLAIMNVNSAVREAPRPYTKIMNPIPITLEPDKLDEIFGSRTDTPLSYLNGFGVITGNKIKYPSTNNVNPVPDARARIKNTLFYPERTEILTLYSDLLLPGENLNDVARSYLLSQFFFLRFGHAQNVPPVVPCINEIVNQHDITVGEVATRLLEEIDFITKPINIDDDSIQNHHIFDE